MIQQSIMYTAMCDNCGGLHQEDIAAGWSDEDYALECAIDGGWHEEDGKIYCPECHSFNDSNDELIIDKSRTKKLQVHTYSLDLED